MMKEKLEREKRRGRKEKKNSKLPGSQFVDI
jgi:hypothetical protein